MPNDLRHVGILGMRWGHRKAEGPSGPPSADHVRAAMLKKKKVSELSNKDLQDIATRMNLENQFNKVPKSKFDKGKKWLLAAAGVMLAAKVNELGQKYVTLDNIAKVGTAISFALENKAMDYVVKGIKF